jgi:hypothetical protein
MAITLSRALETVDETPARPHDYTSLDTPLCEHDARGEERVDADEGVGIEGDVCNHHCSLLCV